MTINLAKDLISRASITPQDKGCQKLIADRMCNLGFDATHLKYNAVDNLWISHGEGKPVLALLGHTDVVPAGKLDDWKHDPFNPVIEGGLLYGRGAADMKGGVAAMVTAMERFVINHPEHKGTLALLLTSDEEGVAVDGTRKVVDYLNRQKIDIDWCLVGEPSCHKLVGDVIKIGRRGSLSAKLEVHGVQGHVAYPDLAKNPVHLAMPALNELAATIWDNGNDHFPATRFQISNINAGTGADNVIPGVMEILFNFRYSTEFTKDELIERVEAVLDSNQLNYNIEWHSSGLPFITESGVLLENVKSAIREITGLETQTSTEGGTSDGRFIAPTGAEVVELGPLNETIHKVNECVSVKDLEILSEIYENVITRLLT